MFLVHLVGMAVFGAIFIAAYVLLLYVMRVSPVLKSMSKRMRSAYTLMFMVSIFVTATFVSLRVQSLVH